MNSFQNAEQQSATAKESDTVDFAIPAAGEGGNHQYQPGMTMLCLDVDGTLVNHDAHMSPQIRDAAREVVAAGHTVVVATGRSLPATLPIVESLGITRGYAVCSNGAITVKIDADVEPGYQIIDQQTFDPRQALEELAHRLPTARFGVETSAGHFLATERFEDETFGMSPVPVSLAEMQTVPAVRLVVKSDDFSAQEFARMVEGIGLHGVTYAVGWTAWLDISAEGVTKAFALEQLRTSLNVPHEYTVACGDGDNDAEMLRWAHRSVAMGQANPQVQDSANEVTGDVDDDGLHPVLRSVLG